MFQEGIFQARKNVFFYNFSRKAFLMFWEMEARKMQEPHYESFLIF